ncbi:MAG: PRC-barrel domain containing protein [Bryobacterales bacterium]|nr:PRC-barrel domain containing protein [Bryobacterales bacterium]
MAIESNTTNPNWNTREPRDMGTANMDSDGEHKYRRVRSAGTLAGDRVRNSAGEDLGKIEEIMIDVPTGRVAYAVLSFGGFLGMGDKLFALPWDALKLNEDEHEFILNVDKTTLENAPGFDQDDWPDMADPNWGSQIYSHYGSKPYWEKNGTDRDRAFTDKRESEQEKTFKGGSY